MRELLDEIYADWARSEYARTDWMHPDFELVFAPGFLDEGEFQGKDDVSRGWRDWLAQWSWWTATALEYIEAGDRIGVRIQVDGVSKSTGMSLSQESGNLWEFRDGQPFRVTLYTRASTLLEDLAAESA
jgi:ketosteroid isomerase-like protein